MSAARLGVHAARREPGQTQDKGPGEIGLADQRHRPEVLHQGQRFAARQVILAAADQAQVFHVHRAGDDVAQIDLPHHRRDEQEQQQQDADQGHHCLRRHPQQEIAVEGKQRHRRRDFIALECVRGQEVAGNDEKDVDAAGDAGKEHVEGKHQQGADDAYALDILAPLARERMLIVRHGSTARNEKLRFIILSLYFRSILCS
jgi:hypothetical protein